MCYVNETLFYRSFSELSDSMSWQYLGAKLEANKLPPLAAQMSQECHLVVMFDARIQRIIFLKAEN